MTVFRSRLRPGAESEYRAWSARMSELARAMPGHIAHKTFVSEDGERVTLAEASESQIAWRDLPEHVEAQAKGREDFYLEYGIQVCEVVRTTRFEQIRSERED